MADHQYPAREIGGDHLTKRRPRAARDDAAQWSNKYRAAHAVLVEIAAALHCPYGEVGAQSVVLAAQNTRAALESVVAEVQHEPHRTTPRAAVVIALAVLREPWHERNNQMET